MGYLYERLKKVLGGDKLTESTNKVITDWSPNDIRAIFIGRSYIIVVRHLGVFGNCTRYISLDAGLLAEDIEDMKRKYAGMPKLNSLLTKRSLSCLEEFYIDVVYPPEIISLNDFVTSLLRTGNSRLRYAGYASFDTDFKVLIDYLNNAYKKAYSEKNYGYSFAMDDAKPVRFNAKSTGNKEWYKKYYLRPQFYKKDNPGGDLDIHFKKIEIGYPESIKKLVSDKIAKGMLEKANTLYCRDRANKDYLMSVDKILSFVGKSPDKVSKIVFDLMKKELSKSRVVEGFTPKELSKAIGESIGGDLDEYIVRCYQNYKVFDNDFSHSLNVSKCFETSGGFIPLGAILDSICLSVAGAMVREGFGDVVGMALYMVNAIPNGEFRTKYWKKRAVAECNDYSGYIEFLAEVVGVEV